MIVDLNSVAPHVSCHTDDQFRDKFLWGRRPMLQELARRFQNAPEGSLTWVDLGGGTGVCLCDDIGVHLGGTIMHVPSTYKCFSGASISDPTQSTASNPQQNHRKTYR